MTSGLIGPQDIVKSLHLFQNRAKNGLKLILALTVVIITSVYGINTSRHDGFGGSLIVTDIVISRLAFQNQKDDTSNSVTVSNLVEEDLVQEVEEDVWQIVPRIPVIQPDANVQMDIMEPNVKTNVKSVFIRIYSIIEER